MELLLIIRSASFQQLDNNFVHIRKRFPHHEIHMLTHEHGKKLAERYAFVSRVIIYPYAEQFSGGHSIPELTAVRYDDVLVPVANLSGSGYANVFALAVSLSAKRVHRCNLVGEIIELEPGGIRRMLRRDHLCRVAGAVAGNVVGLAAVLWFIVAIPALKVFGRKDEETE